MRSARAPATGRPTIETGCSSRRRLSRGEAAAADGEEEAGRAGDQDEGGRHPQDDRVGVHRRAQKDEIAVARHDEVDHLVVRITRLDALAHQADQAFAAQAAVLLALVLVLVIAVPIMMSSGTIAKALGRTGMNMISRLLGMLLMALATQYVFDGVRVGILERVGSG